MWYYKTALLQMSIYCGQRICSNIKWFIEPLDAAYIYDKQPL